MKKITMMLGLCFALISTNGLFGQAGSYTLTTSTATFTPLSSGIDADAVEDDDFLSASLPIGFNFVFEGTTYTNFIASSNGWISLGTPGGSAAGNDLDGIAASSRPMIAPLWDDLAGVSSSSSKASYEVSGVAPNRVLTFEWLSWEWRYTATDSVVSFQVKLYETTNEIAFTYKWENYSALDGPSASIGLSGANSFLSVSGIDLGTPTISNTIETSTIDSVVTDQVLTFTPPPCPAPFALVDSNITTTSIDLGWQSGGSGPWYVYWGPCGFNQASATQTIDTATSSTYTLSGLTPGTSYQIYLFEACGTDLSDTIDGGCVNTKCITQNLPFFEYFDFNLGCFSIADSGSNSASWEAVPPGGTPNLSGDFDGTGYAIADSDGAGSGVTMNEYLISPVIDASTVVGNLILDFDQWYNNIGGDFGDVEVWDGTQWVVLLNQTADAGTGFGSFDHQTIDISAYANANLQVRFHYYNAVFAWHWAVDNFSIRDVVCAPSTSISAFAVSSDSIALSWNTGGANTVNFGIEYGLQGFAPGGGIKSSTVDTFAVFKPLSPNTTYDFYITDTCASGFSLVSGPFTVSTPCVKQLIPYTESFSTDLGCFIVTQNGGTTADTWNWIADYNTNNLDGGNGFMFVDSDGAGSGVAMDEIVTSPTFDATGVTGALILEFDQYLNHLNTDTAAVDVWDGTQWVNILKQSSDIGGWGAPDHQFIDVTAYINANFQVRFHYYNAVFAWFWAIDNFSLTTLPCGIASNLGAGGITPFSADLNWTSNATNWNIEWGPQGFFQGSGSTGNGTVIKNVTTNPYTLASLAPDSCYDYYVQDTCIGSGSGTWIGPFTFCTPPTCPAPTALGVDLLGITINSADIYWTPSLATNFNIEYGTAGFSQGSGFKVQSTNDTLTLNNLMSGTEYEFWVRDSCSATDTSAWAGPFSFFTAFNTDYLDDFDLSNPLAWTEAVGRIANPTSFTSTFSGWGQDNFGNIGSSSQRINLFAANQYDWLISPSIYLDPLKTNLQAEFDVSISLYNANGQGTLAATDDTLALVISTDNGVTWSKSDILWHTDANGTVNVAGDHITVLLTGYSGYVKFALYGGSAIDDAPDNDLYVDNFEVREPRACPSPTGIAISDIKTDSATVDWTVGTSGFLSASVIYTVGNQPASMGTTVPATTNSLVLFGLTQSTEYCVYVVEQCANGYSDTVGPVCFTTNCVPFVAPYYEDFDGSSWIADNISISSAENSVIGNCWSRNPDNGSDYSFRVRGVTTASGSTGPDTDSTGGSFVYTEDSPSNVGDSAMLTSPWVDMANLTTPELSFAYYFYGAVIDRMYIQINNGNGWTTIDTIIGSIQTGGSQNWLVRTEDLSSYLSQTIQVRFIGIGAGCCMGDMALDAFKVADANSSSCVPPSALVAAVVACDTVLLTWTSDAATTSSHLVYGAKGFNIATGTPVPNVSSPYILSGLMLNTEYDFYIIDSCATGASVPAGPFTFKTDSVGPVWASFSYSQSDTTLVDATIDFDGSASTGDGLTYAWDFGNSTTGTGATAGGTYTANQSYNVTLTVTDRCGNTDDTTVAVIVTHISIVENVYDASIDVYPNPSKGDFKVKISGANVDYDLEVMDLSGKMIYKMTDLVSEVEQTINLGDVASGVYIVRLSGKGLNATQRITID